LDDREKERGTEWMARVRVLDLDTVLGAGGGARDFTGMASFESAKIEGPGGCCG
jgi:hypothetical protein